MKHNFSSCYENIALRPLSIEDIELLRQWRNNKDNTKYLR